MVLISAAIAITMVIFIIIVITMAFRGSSVYVCVPFVAQWSLDLGQLCSRTPIASTPCDAHQLSDGYRLESSKLGICCAAPHLRHPGYELLMSKGLIHPTGPLPHGCNLDDSSTRCTSLELCVSFQGVALVARRV